MMWQPIDQAPLNKQLAIIGTQLGYDIITNGVVLPTTNGGTTIFTAQDCTPRLFIELPEDFNP